MDIEEDNGSKVDEVRYNGNGAFLENLKDQVGARFSWGKNLSGCYESTLI